MNLVVRYYQNLWSRVNAVAGRRYAFQIVTRGILSEIAKLPSLLRIVARQGTAGLMVGAFPSTDVQSISGALRDRGIDVRPYYIDPAALRAHRKLADYPANYAAGPVDAGGALDHKILEYHVSMDVLGIQPDETVMDVASEWSLFPELIRKMVGAEVYRLDLAYPKGTHGFTIGANAASMPVPDDSVDKMILHNAFEHFEGDADIRFMAEAFRVLRPGGKLCILPLLLADSYAIITDPLVSRQGIQWDEGAEIIDMPWRWHNRFGRYYDVSAFKRRVIDAVKEFEPTVYVSQGLDRLHPHAYLDFSLIMTKPQRLSESTPAQ